MHHLLPMGRLERVADGARDAKRFLDRQLMLALQPRAQRLAREARHRVPGKRGSIGAGERPRIEQRKDVRVLEPRRQAQLTNEAVDGDRAGEIRMQRLDRDRPLVERVAGLPHRSHAAATELALDYVATAECDPPQVVHVA